MRRLGRPERDGFLGRNSDAGDDWSGGSVMAGTGSLDILLELPYDSGASARQTLLRGGNSSSFWGVAQQCASQTKAWVGRGWARESLLLFGAGWEFMNMNRVVELGAQVTGALKTTFPTAACCLRVATTHVRCSAGHAALVAARQANPAMQRPQPLEHPPRAPPHIAGPFLPAR
jgi:hypothetical protein